MVMHMCFGCLHTFPAAAVEEVPLDERVGRRFEAMRALIGRVCPPGASSPLAVEMEEALRGLVRVVKASMDERNAEIEQLSAHVRFLAEQEQAARETCTALKAAQPAASTGRSPRGNKSGASPSVGLLERFLLASQKRPSALSRMGPTVRSPRLEEDRFGNALCLTPGSSAGISPRKPPTPAGAGSRSGGAACPTRFAGGKQLVSGTLHTLLEAVVVRTNAEIGVLWLRAAEADGLVAPLVAGRVRVRPSAPPYIGLNTVPGSVANTGVALNMTAFVPDPSAFRAATTHELVANVCVQHSSLSIPVFSRYGESARTVVGVLQLFGGSPIGAPFTTDDERFAETAAALLSTIITAHYDTMIGDWMTQSFDPSSIPTATPRYFADIDQNAAAKGTDAGPSAPTLVYRARYTGTTGRGQEGPIKLRNLRADMVAFGAATEAGSGLRDIGRYLNELEDTYRRTSAHLLGVQHSVQSPASPSSLSPASGALPPVGGAKPSSAAPNPRRATTHHRPTTISAADMEDLEVDTVSRLDAFKQAKEALQR